MVRWATAAIALCAIVLAFVLRERSESPREAEQISAHLPATAPAAQDSPPVQGPSAPVREAQQLPSSLRGIADPRWDLVERMKAIEMLGRGDKETAAPMLRDLLTRKTEDPSLRHHAGLKLIGWQDREAREAITTMAFDESESPLWRNYCVQFLHDIYVQAPSPAGLEALFKAAGSDTAEVRSCAIWGLARIATNPALPVSANETFRGQVAEIALAALACESVVLRTAGVQACARLRLEQALPAIRGFATNPPRPGGRFLQLASIACLADYPRESTEGLLRQLAASPEKDVKRAAISALGKLGSSGTARSSPVPSAETSPGTPEGEAARTPP
jgi:HEAT repeat protein